MASVSEASGIAFGELFFDIDAVEDKAFRDSTVWLRGVVQITAPRTTYSLFAVVDRRDNRDHRWSLHGFGGRGIVGIPTCGEVREVEAGIEGYITYGLGLFGQYNARYGLEIPPETSWSRRAFTESNSIFSEDPDEDRWGASLRIEKSNLIFARGFSPFVQDAYERVDSGITAFSYTETAVRIGLNRQF